MIKYEVNDSGRAILYCTGSTMDLAGQVSYLAYRIHNSMNGNPTAQKQFRDILQATMKDGAPTWEVDPKVEIRNPLARQEREQNG